MYLAGWRGFLPVDKVHVLLWMERFHSSQQVTCTSQAGRKPFQPAIGLGDTWISARFGGGEAAIRSQIRTSWPVLAKDILQPSLFTTLEMSIHILTLWFVKIINRSYKSGKK
jgi:hypothetical protein